METRFNLKKEKNSPEGTIYFIFNFAPGEQARISTGLKLSVKEWAKGLPKKTANKNVRDSIVAYQSKINYFISKTIEEKHRNPSKNELQEFIDILLGRKKAPSFQIEDLIVEYLADEGIERKTIKKQKNHLKMFTDYTRKGITVTDLNIELFDKYKKYLLTFNWQLSNLNNYLKSLKGFLRWCFKKKKTQENFSIYIDLFSEITQEIIALEQKEIEILENSQLIPRLQKVVDLFLFSCYTGLRYSDVKKVSKELISVDEDGTEIINILQQKTTDSVSIPVIPQTKRILDKYNYELPIISAQKVNDFLKEAFKILELNRNVQIYNQTIKGTTTQTFPLYEVISFHKGRKSFITQMLTSGVPAEVVKKISGHKSEESFQRYIRFSNDTLKKEMQKFSQKINNENNVINVE